jgi:hypothetical protein
VLYFLFANKQGFCKQAGTSFVCRALEALFVVWEGCFGVKADEGHPKLSFDATCIDL